ncbi:MAG: transglycosylase SLT domain-containing protein [Aeromonas sp.]
MTDDNKIDSSGAEGGELTALGTVTDLSNITAQLADITTEIEQQGNVSSDLLRQILSEQIAANSAKKASSSTSANDANNGAISGKPSAKSSKSSANYARNGAKQEPRGGVPSANMVVTGAKKEQQGAISAINSANEDQKGASTAAQKNGTSGSKAGHSGLQVIDVTPQVINLQPTEIATPAKPDNSAARPVNGIDTPAALTPAATRKKRTIELAGDSAAQPAAIAQGGTAKENAAAPAAPATPPAPTIDPPKSAGFYLGDDGKLRRPDGRFASKVEVRRFNGESGPSEGGGSSGAGTSPALLIRAVAAISKISNSASSAANSEVGDIAGVGAGGSFFLAAKEIASLVGSTSDTLTGMADGIKDKFGGKGEKSAAPATVNAAPEGNERSTKAAGGPRKKPMPPRVVDGERRAPRKFQKAGKPAGSGVIAAIKGKITNTSATKSVIAPVTRRPAKEFAKSDVSKSAAASQLDAKNTLSRSIADKASDQSESQHDEVIKKLDDLIDAVKPKAPGAMDSVMDLAGDLLGRRGGRGKDKRGRNSKNKLGRNGRDRNWRDRSDKKPRTRKQPGDVDVDGRSKKTAKARRSPADAKRPKVKPKAPKIPKIPKDASKLSKLSKLGKFGKFAKVAAVLGTGVGAGINAMPAVSSAANRFGGAALEGGKAIANRGAAVLKGGGAVGEAVLKGGSSVAKGGGAILKGGGAMLKGGGMALGRMAGMGARAIPVVGQVLALGMAAADAYDGYNDTEGHTRAFGLKEGVEATTAQKSSMAAAKVLDLGGLTSGVAGLLGSAAGALGFEKLEKSLQFDPDGMARAIYKGMTIFDQKKAEEIASVPPGTAPPSISINTNYAPPPASNFAGTPAAQGDVSSWSSMPQHGPVSGPASSSLTDRDTGLPPGYLAAMTHVESRGNPNAYNKSGATGLFQIMPKTAQGLGISMADARNPAKATEAIARFTKDNQRYFKKTMGREAQGRELYLMHQQGMGGGTKLLKNPNARAADVLQSKGVNGMQAVLQNGGRADMTAKEFSDLILAKYDAAEARNKAHPELAADLDGMTGRRAREAKNPKPPKPVASPAAQAAKAAGIPAMLSPAAAGDAASTLAGGLPPLGGPMSAGAAAGAPAAPVQPVTAPAVTVVAAAPRAPVIAPVIDIQERQRSKELVERSTKPYAPGTDPSMAMLPVLKSMDKTLKDMSKKETPKAQSGGPVRSGGKPPASGHPQASGQMAKLANDGR